MTKDGSKEGIEAFDKALYAPPAGVAKEVIAELPEWQKDAQANQFMSQLASRGTQARTSS